AQKLPNDRTDRHALAVLIYMYLLKRHPLRGGRNLGEAEEDERLQMGDRALWIEDPDDRSNRPDLRDPDEKEENKRWLDVEALPYTALGPFLAPLVSKAFRDGLKTPEVRPRADDWEDALVRSGDLLMPCVNPNCSEKWFMLNMQGIDGPAPQPLKVQVCPFCKTKSSVDTPFLNFYSYRRVEGVGKYLLDGRKLVIFNGQELMLWHMSTKAEYTPNERLTNEMRRRVGVFQFHQNAWYLRNERMPNLMVVESGKNRLVPPGQSVILSDAMQLQLDSPTNDGRMATVQITGIRPGA
ncbi:MAG: kinase, partial [Chloroflexi bacterium]|nr:kinase [Chloroflexota bacterium]